MTLVQQPRHNAATPIEAVISPLQTHFYLQHSATGCYFQGIERWTHELDRSMVFYDVSEALYICRWLGLSDVRIVSDFELLDTVEALPCVA